jgi:hypothetical protein
VLQLLETALFAVASHRCIQQLNLSPNSCCFCAGLTQHLPRLFLIIFTTPFDLRDGDGLVVSPFAVGEEEAAAVVKRRGNLFFLDQICGSDVGCFVGMDAAVRCSSAIGPWEV